MSGKLVDGALRVFHLGKVSKGEDDAAKRAVGMEFGDGVEVGPEDFLEVRNAITNHLAIDRLPSGDYASEGTRLFGEWASVFG